MAPIPCRTFFLHGVARRYHIEDGWPAAARLRSDIMDRPLSHPEQVALNMLNRYGLAAIWQLHLSAAKAYREGHGLAARSIIDVADAAERMWLKRSAEDRTGSENRTGSPQQ